MKRCSPLSAWIRLLRCGAAIALGCSLRLAAQPYDIADYFYLPESLTPPTTWHYDDVEQTTPGDSDAFEWRILDSFQGVGSGDAYKFQILADEGESEDRHEDIDLFRLNPVTEQLEYWGGKFKKLADAPVVGSYLPEFIVLDDPVVFGQAGMTVGQQIPSQGQTTIGGLPLGASATVTATGNVVVVEWLPTKDTFLGVFQDVLVVDVTIGIRIVAHSFLGDNEVFNDTFLNNRFYLARNVGLIYQVQNVDENDATEQSIDAGQLRGEAIQPGGGDTGEILLNVVDGQTSENGDTGTFTIVLSKEPAADVTVEISSNNPDEGVVTGADRATSVIFNDQNWNQARTVTVQGQNDDIIDGPVDYGFIFVVGTTDPNYQGVTPDPITFTNLDNDTPGVDIIVYSDQTSEDGETAQFAIRLATQPSANVEITVRSDDLTEAEIDGLSVGREVVAVFTAANWADIQTVTVRGVDDGDKDDDTAFTVSFTVASADTNYDGLSVDAVEMINIDNDLARINAEDYFVLDPPETTWRYVPYLDPPGRSARPAALFGNVIFPDQGYEWIIENATQPVGGTQATRILTDSLDPDVEMKGTVQFWSFNAGGDLLNHGMYQPVEIEQEIQGVDMVIPPQDILFADPILFGIRGMKEGQPLITDTTASIAYSIAGFGRGERLSMTVDVHTEVTLLSVLPVKETPMGGFYNVAVLKAVFDIPIQSRTFILFAAPGVGVIAQKAGADPNVPEGWALVSGSIGPQPVVADRPKCGLNVLVNDSVTGENGEKGSFEVALISAPQDTVVVAITSDDASEGEVLDPSGRGATLTFDDTDWHLPQLVEVLGKDDDEEDGWVDYTVTFALSSGDADFDGNLHGLLTLTNADDDFSIRGTVTYEGFVPADTVIVRVHDDAQGIVHDVTLSGPGPYVAEPLSAGTYRVMAWVEIDLNGVPDHYEPVGIYETRAAIDLPVPPSRIFIDFPIEENLTDLEGDGLPDSYEAVVFGNMGEIGSGDYDGDGEDNETEYLNETDPRDARSTSDPGNTYNAFLFEVLQSASQLPAGRAFGTPSYGGNIICEAPPGSSFTSGTVQFPDNGGQQEVVLMPGSGGAVLYMLYQAPGSTPAEAFQALSETFEPGVYRFDLVLVSADRDDPQHLRFNLELPAYADTTFPLFVNVQSPAPDETGVSITPLFDFNSTTWDTLDIYTDQQTLLYTHSRSAADDPPDTHQLAAEDALPAASTFTLRVVEWDRGNSWLAAHTLLDFTTARLLNLVAEWNFVSIPSGLPAGVASRSVAALFGSALQGRGSGAWAHDPHRQRYLDATATEPLSEISGYWVYVNAATMLDYTPGDEPVPTEVALSEGSNAVSVPDGLVSYAVGDVFGAPEIVAVWGWDAAAQSYYPVTGTLSPDRAYWVIATADLVVPFDMAVR